MVVTFIFFSAAVVFQEAIPNGFESSTSGRMESLLFPIVKSTTFRLSIQAFILREVTWRRIWYQRFFSKLINFLVSLSDASSPLILLRPTVVPPHPPTIRVQGSLPTGNVIPQKKSFPSTRFASRETS